MNRKGMTLIELLVVLVISGILIAGVYRTFIQQQHTFTVQEQVVDMQQNIRLAINRMTRELRMAGFGTTDGIALGGGGVNGFNQFVTPGAYSVTVVEGFQTLIQTTLSANASIGSHSIFVNDASSFDTGARKYISINGVESHRIETIVGNEIRFPSNKLTNEHWVGEPVYLVMAITYSHGVPGDPFRGVPGDPLLRNDNLGFGPQPVAENIENIEFRNPDGSTPLNPNSACMQVTITARTDRPDADLAKAGDGFRKRTLTSNIKLRNIGLP